jgi:hypothetical protein
MFTNLEKDGFILTGSKDVFEFTGYKKICDKLGAEVIYLDEEDTKTFEFKGKSSVKDDSKGYHLKPSI